MNPHTLEEAMAAANGRPAPGVIVDPGTGRRLSGGLDPSDRREPLSLTELARRIFDVENNR